MCTLLHLLQNAMHFSWQGTAMLLLCSFCYLCHWLLLGWQCGFEFILCSFFMNMMIRLFWQYQGENKFVGVSDGYQGENKLVGDSTVYVRIDLSNMGCVHFVEAGTRFHYLKKIYPICFANINTIRKFRYDIGCVSTLPDPVSLLNHTQMVLNFVRRTIEWRRRSESYLVYFYFLYVVLR